MSPGSARADSRSPVCAGVAGSGGSSIRSVTRMPGYSWSAAERSVWRTTLGSSRSEGTMTVTVGLYRSKASSISFRGVLRCALIREM